jgi:ankyrin repeat protein
MTNLDDVQTRYQALVSDTALQAEPITQIAMFDAVKLGDAVTLYKAVTTNPDLLTAQDDHGMTALHYASADHSGLLARILIETPNLAPAMLDKYERTALDVTIDNYNQAGQDILFPITYARQFLQAELANELGQDWLADKLRPFASLMREAERSQATTRQKDNTRDQSGGQDI